MSLHQDRVALNAIQWINVKADPTDPASEDRLDEQISFLGEAAEILAAEGVRAGLHNHVGTWIETEDEIEQTLDLVGMLDALPASFDGWLIVEVDRTNLDPYVSAQMSWEWVHQNVPA